MRFGFHELFSNCALFYFFQTVVASSGNVVQNSIDQEEEQPDLTQQTEEFEPLQSSQQSVPSDTEQFNHNQPLEYTGGNQIRPVHQSSSFINTYTKPQEEENTVGQELDNSETGITNSGNIHTPQDEQFVSTLITQ